MRKSTMVELVQELDSRNVDNLYDNIIEEAKAGEFHDYKNDKYLCGKMALIEKLSKFPELKYIETQVRNGDYDESPDDDDKRLMAEGLKGSVVGEAMIKIMGLDKFKT